jgi:hypothetical protein
MLMTFMLTVTYAECHTKAPYPECHYAERRYADYRDPKKYSENLLRPIFTLKFSLR